MNACSVASLARSSTIPCIMKHSMHLLWIAPLVLLLGAASHARAAPFNARCLGSVDSCATLIADEVTETFTTNYPADRFEIVLMSYSGRGGDGAGLTYAVAFVSPINTQDPQEIRIGRYRTSSIAAIDPTRASRSGALMALERANIRQAVSKLMAHCQVDCRSLLVSPGSLAR